MPTSFCLVAGCPEKATYRGRCRTHTRQNERTINRAGKQVYNTKRWKLTRRRVLFEQPLCLCGEISTDVHHLVDLADGGAPYDQANLQALCHICHSRTSRARQVESKD